MRHRRTAAVYLLAVCLLATAAAEQVNKLKPTGYVNDFAGVLSARTSSDIYQLCSLIEEKAGAQVAVVTIHTLEGSEASDFANRLFAKWGVGHKDNRGVLILLAVDDHKYFTEVGYGLEPILPDGKVGGFGREMVPFLKRSDYNNAVLLMTQRVAAVIAQDRGVNLPPQTQIRAPARPSGSSDTNIPPALILFIVVFIFFVVFSILGAIWRALKYAITGKRPPPGRGGWFGPGGFWMGGGGLGGGSGWSGGFGGGGGFGGFGGGMSGGGGAGGSW